MAPPFCEVALSVPLRTTFTYAIPQALGDRVMPGSRVLVPFRNRTCVGVVLRLTDSGPPTSRIKEVAEVLDPVPALPDRLLELGRWVSKYYLAPIGEVLRAMLPPAVELKQRCELHLAPAGRERLAELASLANRSEAEVAEHGLLQLLEVSEKPLRWERLRKLPGGESVAARLLRRGEIRSEEVTTRRAVRSQKIVGWNAAAEAAIGAVRETPATRATENRVRCLLAEERGPLPLKVLLKEVGVTRSTIDRLLGQGKLTMWEEAIPEEDFLEGDFTPPANVLNAGQRRALDEICGWLAAGEFTVGLLHGVTGSGKTEVYLCAVEAALARGRTALILVPEIALTLWIGRLCRAWFGASLADGIAVLHSGLADAERSREWWRARHGQARVVVGTRSAVFAPLENVGLVIVDEEQESSYKQEETPRYHGRDTAIVRAKLENATVVLGSATPSLESFHHARSGKYRLLRLEARVEDRPLAAVEIVDLREEFHRTLRTSILSEKLRAAIAERLAGGTQSLLLVNRRGYSWFMICRSCGAAVRCENCSISLTYHKRQGRLTCHYCGYSRGVPETCPNCSSPYVYFFGEGAEQIEERLREIFPSARIGRLDRDTVRTKRAFQQILGAFAAGKLDILVGTQMIAKGHDFQRVTLVGVVATDTMLSLPDFRAAERTFQLLTQVAGRAGRGVLPGTVLVETYYPDHYAIAYAARQDYVSFFEKELQFRRWMHYPPFMSLANVMVRDRKMENAIRWSRQIAGFFAPLESSALKILGPAPAPVARLRREYRFQFLLKAPKRALLTQALTRCLDFCDRKEIPQTAVMVDVDPLSLF